MPILGSGRILSAVVTQGTAVDVRLSADHITFDFAVSPDFMGNQTIEESKRLSNGISVRSNV